MKRSVLMSLALILVASLAWGVRVEQFPAGIETPHMNAMRFPDADVSDHSSAVTVGSIAYHIAQVDGAGASIELPGGKTYDVDDNLSIPANIQLHFQKGALLNIASGKKVAVDHPAQIVAQGNQQVFSGEGRVEFATPGVQWANWWGAKADKTDASGTTNAIQAAITAAVPTGACPLKSNDRTTHAGTVKLACGHYLIDAPLVTPTDIHGLTIEGDCGAMHGFGVTTVQWAGDNLTDADDWMLVVGSVLGFRLSRVAFIGVADTDNATSRTIQNGIFVRRVGINYQSANAWEDVSVKYFPGIGVQFGDYTATDGGEGEETTNTDNSYIKNLFVENCRTGMVIDSPNFLQVHFSRLIITNYGGNPVDENGTPTESESATPIKFRTKNAVRVLHGELQAVDSTFIASYFDDDNESQYAIYVNKGSINIQGGYSETRFLAYFDTGETSVMNVNSISDYHLFPGSAGGPETTGKHPIRYRQTQVPLTLMGTKDIYVVEDEGSGGVQSIGCRSQQAFISTTDFDILGRNPRSNDWGAVTMTPQFDENSTLTGLGWDSQNQFGLWGRIGTYDNGKILISTNLVKRTSYDGDCYLFMPGNDNDTIANGIIIDGNGVQSFAASGLQKNACYTLDLILGTWNTKVYPTLQGAWTYDDETRKAGYRYLADRRAFVLFGSVSGGDGAIFYSLARPGTGKYLHVATTSNGGDPCALLIDQNGAIYVEKGSTTSVSLDGIVLMID